LSYLPQSNREKPARVDWGDSPDRKADFFGMVPASPVKPYDMHKLIEAVFDRKPDGSRNYFELFPEFATNLIT
jgi:propionyl-CoA carboxylase beta chain